MGCSTGLRADLSSSAANFSSSRGWRYDAPLRVRRMREAALRHRLTLRGKDEIWLVLLALCASADPGFAASRFQGPGNILLVTQHGACDRFKSPTGRCGIRTCADCTAESHPPARSALR